MPISVVIDPTVPLGTESLKLGDDRIRDVAKWLQQCFGFPGTAVASFQNPFDFVDNVAGTVKVRADATDPLGVVTLEQIQRTALFVSISSTDGIGYTGAPTPALTVYSPNALYLLQNVGPANAGPTTLSLSGLIPAPLVRADGTQLAAGDLFDGTSVSYLALAGFDGTKFRLIDFLGGTTTHQITTPGVLLTGFDPTTAPALQVPSKGYVDGVIGATPTPMVVNMTTAFVNLTANAVSTVMTMTLAIPSDGNYLIAVDYSVFGIMSSSVSANKALYAFVNDGMASFAVGGYDKATNGMENCSINSGGMSPTTYAAGASVTLNMQMVSTDGDGTPGKVQALSIPAGAPAALPQARFTATLMRTHS